MKYREVKGLKGATYVYLDALNIKYRGFIFLFTKDTKIDSYVIEEVRGKAREYMRMQKFIDDWMANENT